LWLNGASYSKSYYWEPIGSRIWEIDWYQNEWPWPLFRGRIKVKSTIALHLTLNISETVRDRGLVPKDYYSFLSYCRDLGVTVASDLSFSMHVKNIVAKAHQRANVIHRCFISRNTDLLVRAYLTYVRPLLEYNSIIWSPHSIGDVDAIEKVQRRFTKRIPGFKNYSYVERLHLLHMPRLEMRRIQNDLILVL